VVSHVQFGRHAPSQLASAFGPSHSSDGPLTAPSPQKALTTVFPNRIAPGPGKPAVLLTAGLVVGGMQNADPSTFVVVLG
jgi:hypothetical protein